MIHVLGIETSCDECSASVVKHEPSPDSAGRFQVMSVSTFSQTSIHEPYGGVVPEIASRNHLETINPMINVALSEAMIKPSQIGGISVTNRPGLVGALLVGVSAAKALAYALSKPLIAVHHLEGHLASLFLDRELPNSKELYPLLAAIISGGHTQLHVIDQPPPQWPEDFLARTKVGNSRDDAAGEAFDKTAKLLGFPYPGGVWIDQMAKGGNPEAFNLPRALPQKALLDFSFSGLKTAVSLQVKSLEQNGELESRIPDLCASIQEAIVDALWSKMKLAIEKHHCKALAIVGGVAANSRLRERLARECSVPVHFPLPKYCTDNGAMIAAAGAIRLQQGRALDRNSVLRLNAIAHPEI